MKIRSVMEALNKSARTLGRGFFFKPRFGKCRNTGCISNFPNRRIGGKDLSSAAALFIQRFLMYLLLLAVIVASFSGCAEKTEEVILKNQDTIIYLDAPELSKEELAAIFSEKPTALQLQERLSNISFKKNELFYYTVVKSSNHLIMLIFDLESITYVRNCEILFSSIESKEKLQQIAAGDTTDTVTEADELGTYPFFYASWSKYPQYSYHFFEDGTCYNIWYEDYIVTGILSFTI